MASPDEPTESDVSADRGAALGHESLEKGHECPLAGKSSMQWFPAIVLQPGAQISLVQVALFPLGARTLSHFSDTFDSFSFTRHITVHFKSSQVLQYVTTCLL